MTISRRSAGVTRDSVVRRAVVRGAGRVNRRSTGRCGPCLVAALSSPELCRRCCRGNYGTLAWLCHCCHVSSLLTETLQGLQAGVCGNRGRRRRWRASARDSILPAASDRACDWCSLLDRLRVRRDDPPRSDLGIGSDAGRLLPTTRRRARPDRQHLPHLYFHCWEYEALAATVLLARGGLVHLSLRFVRPALDELLWMSLMRDLTREQASVLLYVIGSSDGIGVVVRAA